MCTDGLNMQKLTDKVHIVRNLLSAYLKHG